MPKSKAVAEPKRESRVARGLEGIYASETALSRVEGDIGRLSYCGYDIRDLAEYSTFEETIYLLWHGELPNAQQLAQFHRLLAAERELPVGLVYTMRTLPHNTPPMDALRSCVSLLSTYDPDDPEDRSDEARWRRAIRIQAKMPAIVATYNRLRTGHEPVPPDSSLSLAGNFLYQLQGERPDEMDEHVFDVGLVLHADHSLNASTFAARVVVSTESDIYSAITAAIGTLKGPLHGGANQEVIKMLHEIGLLDRCEPYIMRKLDRGEKIMGFGHRVYRNGDPRADILREYSRTMGERAGDDTWYRMSKRIEEIVTREKGLHCNVDFYSASVYHTLSIPHDIYTPIFAASRVAGWLAHVMEQLGDNRLIRPLAEWIGHEARPYVPIEQR